MLVNVSMPLSTCDTRKDRAANVKSFATPKNQIYSFPEVQKFQGPAGWLKIRQSTREESLVQQSWYTNMYDTPSAVAPVFAF